MEHNHTDFYAAKHKEDMVRLNSRSGGVFTAISDIVFSQEGVVYGCSMNEHLKAIHIRTEDCSGRDRCRGSKYVQSDMGMMYVRVREDLYNNRVVLFSGTPCQCQGLKNYLIVSGASTKKLLLVDVVCHGVTSPLLLDEYIKYQEKRYQGRVTGINFRNKVRYGWSSHVETIVVNQKERDSDIFAKLFYNNNGLRRSCYECHFKSLTRCTDLSLADFWGINKAVPDFDDNKGVSLVLVNSEKGRSYFQRSKAVLDYVACPIEACMQPALRGSLAYPLKRQDFWHDYAGMDFSRLISKYITEKNLYRRLKTQFKYWIYSRMK